MTKEEKELLLKDLCSRLPYGVKVDAGEDLAMTLKQIDYNGFCESSENEDIKCFSRWMLPYLRSMSSITEEEWEDYQKIRMTDWVHGDINGTFINAGLIVDWLLKNHFDFRGLIPKGLALEAKEGMFLSQKKE